MSNPRGLPAILPSLDVARRISPRAGSTPGRRPSQVPTRTAGPHRIPGSLGRGGRRTVLDDRGLRSSRPAPAFGPTGTRRGPGVGPSDRHAPRIRPRSPGSIPASTCRWGGEAGSGSRGRGISEGPRVGSWRRVGTVTLGTLATVSGGLPKPAKMADVVAGMSLAVGTAGAGSAARVSVARRGLNALETVSAAGPVGAAPGVVILSGAPMERTAVVPVVGVIPRDVASSAGVAIAMGATRVAVAVVVVVEPEVEITVDPVGETATVAVVAGVIARAGISRVQ